MLSLINKSNEDSIPESLKENFTTLDLFAEVYEVMKPKFIQKKLEYIQIIDPEVQQININSEK